MAKIEAINSQNLGYQTGPTKWTDRTEEEYRSSLSSVSNIIQT